MDSDGEEGQQRATASKDQVVVAEFISQRSYCKREGGSCDSEGVVIVMVMVAKKRS